MNRPTQAGRSRRAGFTLLELVLVIVILAVAASLVLPRLPRMASSERNEALRKLAYATQALHEHAAFKKKV